VLNQIVPSVFDVLFIILDKLQDANSLISCSFLQPLLIIKKVIKIIVIDFRD
jgi:hypothetical protein